MSGRHQLQLQQREIELLHGKFLEAERSHFLTYIAACPLAINAEVGFDPFDDSPASARESDCTFPYYASIVEGVWECQLPRYGYFRREKSTLAASDRRPDEFWIGDELFHGLPIGKGADPDLDEPTEAACLLSVCPGTAAALVASGDLNSFRLGRARRIPVASIVKLIEVHVADDQRQSNVATSSSQLTSAHAGGEAVLLIYSGPHIRRVTLAKLVRGVLHCRQRHA